MGSWRWDLVGTIFCFTQLLSGFGWCSRVVLECWVAAILEISQEHKLFDNCKEPTCSPDGHCKNCYFKIIHNFNLLLQSSWWFHQFAWPGLLVAFVIWNMCNRKFLEVFGLFPSLSKLHSAWMYVHHQWLHSLKNKIKTKFNLFFKAQLLSF